MPTRTARIDVHLTPADAHAALRADVLLGLTARPKELPPKYFYDARGSALFERDHRAARVLPDPHRGGPARRARRRDRGVVGCGHPRRAGLGVVGEDAAAARRVPARRDAAALRAPGRQRGGAARGARRAVGAVPGAGAARRGRRLHPPPAPAARGRRPGGHRLVAFLGGTIGNLVPAQRATFLARLRAALAPGEQLLLGAALVTDPRRARRGLRRRRGGHRGVQPQRPARAQPRAARRSATSTRSPTSRAGTPSGSGSRCGCGRSGRWR